MNMPIINMNLDIAAGPAHRFQGFTLIELLITLVIAAILVTVAVPSFNNLMSDVKTRSATNQMIASHAYARSEAIKRASPILICPTTDQTTCANSTNWNTGWIVFSDSDLSGAVNDSDELLKVYAATKTNISVGSDVKKMWYGSTGNIYKAE